MTQLEWPETLELTLNGIAQGGEGVGRWQERVVFAGGGLPGERVLVKITERHESYARGQVVDVLLSANERVAPRLPVAGHMPWQHIAYAAQVRFKRQILVDQLVKIAGLVNVSVAETLPAPRPWGYRNSARFHGDGQYIGYHVADSHMLQEITADPLLLPVLNEVLAALQATLRNNELAPTEVVLRASETYGYVLAALRGSGNVRDLAARWRLRCPALAGVVVPVSSERVTMALGADHLIEELGGVAFHLRPTTFFQVNTKAAEALLGLVQVAIGDVAHRRILDLYCGAGTFTLPLALHAREVVGVEEHVGAIEDGRTTALENGIERVRFEAGRVEHVLGQIEGPFDVVVLDPPRRGCNPLALERLIELAPPRIVYISCHPATLARDLRLLIAGGYQVQQVQPVDLFPQTAHIESVSVLVRN